MTLALSNAREPESEEKPQKSLNEKQQVSWPVTCIEQFNIYLLVGSNASNNLHP